MTTAKATEEEAKAADQTWWNKESAEKGYYQFNETAYIATPTKVNETDEKPSGFVLASEDLPEGAAPKYNTWKTH